ncbi:arginyl-tRNA synthetase [Fusarium phyllophilum]|uniref:arginine--tRNA ligase n=1 Tax=Fusarium phyllophilum TaxID=47803 RepID=A0A8H5K0W9_9HYPO|nr:arginyl-tRNA synthetase [Fusarium phyllophilum]
MDEDSTTPDDMDGALVLRSHDTIEQCYELKEWERRFGTNTMPKLRKDYKSLIEIVRSVGIESGEIPSFMFSSPNMPSWERRVSNAESFCEHGDFALQHFVPADESNSRRAYAQEPRAWISDNSSSFQNPVSSGVNKIRTLNNTELKDFLQVKPFGPDATDDVPVHTRRVYISNPNGASILALIRTVPAPQADGFRKLLAGYFTTPPVPSLMLIDSDWWPPASFIIAFNLPFFAISTMERQDHRKCGADKNLRASYSLEFLHLEESSSGEESWDNTTRSDTLVLQGGVFSLMVTGQSDEYWTAVCLNDDFFEEDQHVLDDETLDVDPIIQIPSLSPRNSWSPRAYALLALEQQLEKIIEYHEDVHHHLKISLDRYVSIVQQDAITNNSPKRIQEWRRSFPEVLSSVMNSSSSLALQLHDFILEDLRVGQDEAFHGILWQGLQGDISALRSLRKIKGLHSRLRTTGVHFEHLKIAYETAKHGEESRREAVRNEDVQRGETDTETNNAQPGKEQNKDNTVLRIAIAAFSAFQHSPSCDYEATRTLTSDSSFTLQHHYYHRGYGSDNLLYTPIPEYPGADIVHNPQDIFRVYLADTIQKLVNCDRLVAYDAIQTSNITGMGDLVIVAPKLRLKDVKADELAKDLLQKVYFSPNTLSRLLLSYISDRSTSYGYDTSLGLVDPSIPDGPKKKLLVEFSSPNMASEFQVSHLRSTLIGTYIANIHSNMGWNVVKMNYLGDWGKQIGLLAAGWQRFGSEDEFAKQPLRHLLEVNHKIQDLFKPELEECKATKANKQDVTEIESRGLYAERDIFFKKMEDREPEAIAVWQRFRDATVKDYTESYAQLGVTFDEYSGESQVTAESIAEVEQALKDKGIYDEHDDSLMIDFSKHDARGLSLAVLRYRNGTTSYLLRDLAAVFDRYKKHQFDKMIYVVAMEQEMHFHRVTKTLELMGRQDLAERIQHVSFAKINGLPEDLKGAELLSDYLGGCRSMVQTSLDEEEEETFHVDKSEKSVEQLGLAGLFIQDHYHKRNTSYAVDPKKSLSLEGETGAAIQNCYARLLKKLESGPGSFDYATLDHTSLETEDYAELLRILLQYPDAAHGSFRTLEPSFIVVYLLRIVDQLTATLDDDDEKDWAGLDAASEARYALYENARQVFENALRLLGVSPWSP